MEWPAFAVVLCCGFASVERCLVVWIVGVEGFGGGNPSSSDERSKPLLEAGKFVLWREFGPWLEDCGAAVRSSGGFFKPELFEVTTESDGDVDALLVREDRLFLFFPRIR